MSAADIQTAIKACEERKVELLQTVAPQIVSPNTILPTFDKNGIKIVRPTLLHIACFSGAYDCAKYLIQYDANISANDAEIHFSFMIFIFNFIEHHFILPHSPDIHKLLICYLSIRLIRMLKIFMEFIIVLLDAIT